MSVAKRKPTLAAGAVIERSLLRRHIKRKLAMVLGSSTPWGIGYRAALNEMLSFVDTQPARTKRKGGIGR